MFTIGVSGAENRTGPLYGSSSGETVGFSATTEKTNQPLSTKFGVRHEDRFGLPAISEISVPLDQQLPSVLVIRRDKNFNISAYNYEGELVVSIPASVDKQSNLQSSIASSFSITKDGDTSGTLNVLQVGSAGSNTITSFKGSLGRFGIINRDIQQSAASKLARDLHELYKL